MRALAFLFILVHLATGEMSFALSLSPAEQCARAAEYSAAGCSFVRLDCPGEVLERAPVRDQGEYGTCYAYAAAELLQAYHVRTTGEWREISPFDLALQFKQRFDRKATSIAGGSASDTIDAAFARGHACDDAVEASARLDRLGEWVQERFPPLHHRARSLNTISRLQREPLISDRLRELLAETYPDVERERAEIQSTIARHARASQELAHHSTYRSDAFAALEALFVDRCGQADTRISLARGARTRFTNRPAEFSRFVHRRLNRSASQPVAVALCFELLAKGLVTRAENCEAHSMVVLGRRSVRRISADRGIETKCQLLVKNSHGQSCDGIDARWDCEAESGTIWVDDDALFRSTFDMNAIDISAARAVR